MRRVACPVTVRTWARVPPGRSTLKKPQATIAPAWECGNCDQAGPVRRGAGPVPLGIEDLPYGRRRDVDSQAGQLAVDPAVPPSGVLLG